MLYTIVEKPHFERNLITLYAIHYSGKMRLF